jgi:hypothetical protein
VALESRARRTGRGARGGAGKTPTIRKIGKLLGGTSEYQDDFSIVEFRFPEPA